MLVVSENNIHVKLVCQSNYTMRLVGDEFRKSQELSHKTYVNLFSLVRCPIVVTALKKSPGLIFIQTVRYDVIHWRSVINY